MVSLHLQLLYNERMAVENISIVFVICLVLTRKRRAEIIELLGNNIYWGKSRNVALFGIAVGGVSENNFVGVQSQNAAFPALHTFIGIANQLLSNLLHDTVNDCV